MDLYDELPQSDLLCDDEFSDLLIASEQYQVSVIEFLTLQSKELATLLQRSINEVVKFQQLLFGEFKTQFLETNKIQVLTDGISPLPFSTGDVNIDENLGGGIFTHSITEIFGESSTGKSQFLMQLSLSVQLPSNLGGLGGKCVYIATEGDLPTQRLEELITSRKEFKNHNVTQNNIYTVTCSDLMTQEHILDVQLPVLLEKNKGAIKLIIVDSIAHHMRVELTSTSFKESQDNRFYIDRMAEKLLGLAGKYSLAIVVANQVGDKPLVEATESSYQAVTDYEYQLGWMVGWKDSTILYRQNFNELPSTNKMNVSGVSFYDNMLSDDEDSILIEEELQRLTKSATDSNGFTNRKNEISKAIPSSRSESFPVIARKPLKRRIDRRVPTLGLAWANHVSTRILLSKLYRASALVKRGEIHLYNGSDPSALWQVKRIMKVVFSTYSQPCEVSFIINKRGLESV